MDAKGAKKRDGRRGNEELKKYSCGLIRYGLRVRVCWCCLSYETHGYGLIGISTQYSLLNTLFMNSIIQLRLSNQLLARNTMNDPVDVVQHMCAMQAQDYLASLWAIALRTGSSAEKDIEQAIADGKIVRSWPMRGTLHFVIPGDLKWMLKLMTPRILSGQIKRFLREFEIDTQVLNRSRNILINQLSGDKRLARNDVYRVLEEGGIQANGQRGLHIIWYLAQEGTICFGPREGKQPAFVLLDEWIPHSRELTYEESLAEICYRYFASRGPAALADFIWWTGLTSSLAKTALELVKPKLESIRYNDKEYWMTVSNKPAEPIDNLYHLLPSFDEYLITYTDRSLMLGKYTLKDVVPFSNGMFFPVIVENGMIIGTWKRTIMKNTVKIDFSPFEPFTKKQEKEIQKISEAYRQFLL